jgi:uncharacterized protein DUF5916/cellulose/xylan binding protein with CBM9 domain
MNKVLLCLLLSFLFSFAKSQPISQPDTTKKYTATRISVAPEIDGMLDDEAWKSAAAASDFVMSRPIENSTPTQKTEFKIIYDNTAIYASAMMYDSSPDSILHELGLRDAQDPNGGPHSTLDLNADFFRFVVDPYNARQDAYDFGVYASGVQADSKFSDATFDAVWESAVKITDKGWIAEIKIPYSAIRFPKKEIQTWGLQITRNIRRNREFDQWCLTPSGAYNSQLYWGTLNGIEKVNPPLRLSLTPFISGYVDRSPIYDSDTTFSYTNSFSYNVGADIKYGIDERFTLDMTLLPDFGQVQSDNKIKTLGYQEITYNENRSFFKEATELFDKNGLFYTRRIGKVPSGFYDVDSQLQEGEKIKDNPSQVKLLNAVKISGRSDAGMGIGFFNAVTDNMYAIAEDGAGNTRKILTEPLTNFNVLVFDQQIKSTSSIYFINTNVIRSHKYDDANVSGAGFTLADKKNNYATDGEVDLSQQFTKLEGKETFSDQLGFKYFLGVRKISGKFQAGISRQGINDTYNPLDLGYYVTNNREVNRFYFTYFQFQPNKIFREANLNIGSNYNTTFTNKKRADFQVYTDAWANLLNYNAIFGGGGVAPLVSYDYDPRLEGRFIKTLRYWYAYVGVSSDYRKRLAVDLTQNMSNFMDRFLSEGYNTDLSLRMRVNDKFTLNYSLAFYFDPFNFGYVKYLDDETILYGGRKLYTISNKISARYIFKNDMSASVAARHYWLTGRYRRFFILENNGDYTDFSGEAGNNDFSYNVFNIDFIYSWRFAPGSTLSVAYKNAIENDGPFITQNYKDNLKTTWDFPQTNSFSVKMVYYLDYLYLKRKSL